MRDLPQVCEYLHIPVQSGSDVVLKHMRRQYTVGEYVELIDRGREYVPGLSVASDFVAGFCGETEEDHKASLRQFERCRFKNIFAFKYSPRPGTVAAKRGADDVPDDVRRGRHAELLAIQGRVSAAANQSFIGSTVEVLVEGYSKAGLKAQEAEQARGDEVNQSTTGKSGQLVGRTRTDHIVVFPGKSQHVGRFANIRITAATALTLHGALLEQPSERDGARRRWTDRCRCSVRLEAVAKRG